MLHWARPGRQPADPQPRQGPGRGPYRPPGLRDGRGDRRASTKARHGALASRLLRGLRDRRADVSSSAKQSGLSPGRQNTFSGLYRRTRRRDRARRESRSDARLQSRARRGATRCAPTSAQPRRQVPLRPISPAPPSRPSRARSAHRRWQPRRLRRGPTRCQTDESLRVGDHKSMHAVLCHHPGDLTERRVRGAAEDSMMHAVADADVLKLWGLLSAMGHGRSIAGSRSRSIRGKASPIQVVSHELRARETADSLPISRPSIPTSSGLNDR